MPELLLVFPFLLFFCNKFQSCPGKPDTDTRGIIYLGKELIDAELAFCYCNKLLEIPNFKEMEFILGHGGSLWQRDFVHFMVGMKEPGVHRRGQGCHTSFKDMPTVS